MTESSQGQTERQGGSSALFAVAAIATLLAFYWLFLHQLFVVEDVNMEAMEMPLAVACLEQAREKGMTPHDYFAHDLGWENFKQEDPQGAIRLGRWFQFEFFAFQSPLLGVLYLPFVKLVGMGSWTVEFYSTFFAGLAWLLTGLLAVRMFGRWCGLLAMVLLMSSLSWLIHTKVGYASHLPSAGMMVAEAMAVWAYVRQPQRGPIMVMGALVGLMYMVGWIVHVFGGLMIGLAVALGGPRSFWRATTDLAIAVASAASAVLALTAAYALYYDSSFGEIHGAIWGAFSVRFSQGATPGQELTLAGKMFHAFWCMFWDMRTMDHLDKCLEGYPAIPIVFTLLFFVGLLYSLKERTAADKVLLIWMVSIFGVLGSVFAFTHRYALMALPAMSIVAARGVAGIAGDVCARRYRVAQSALGLIVVLMLGFSLLHTHAQFYVDYMLRKPPNFEVDRIRGHARFAEWLKQTGTPQNTLVVLGDPIMFPHTSFLFNTYGCNYRFVYWSNYFGSNSTPEQVLEWEQRQLAHYRRIVYAFSPLLLANQQTRTFNNDCRPFMAAHPGLLPVWTYSYDGRPPSILVFEMTTPNRTFRNPVFK